MSKISTFELNNDIILMSNVKNEYQYLIKFNKKII